jgi:hypothetical protein
MPKKRTIFSLSSMGDISSLLSFPPVMAGMSALLAVLSQNVPMLSGSGVFGMGVIFFIAYLSVSLSAFLQSKAQRKIRRDDAQANRLKKCLNSIWVGWVVAAVFVGVSIYFLLLNLRPRFPTGYSGLVPKHAIASFREMRSKELIGKTIILSAVPFDEGTNLFISGRTFDQCQLLGPTVIAIDGCRIVQAKFNAPREFFMLESFGTATVGVTHFQSCRFSQCTFDNIAIVVRSNEFEEVSRNIEYYTNAP